MRVLLVGASGFDEKIAGTLADEGVMPALAALRAQAVTGPLHVVSPPRSTLNWVSALTGAAPHEHGIVSTTSLDLETGEARFASIADGPYDPVWHQFSKRGRRAIAVNWPATEGVSEKTGEVIVGADFFARDADVAVGPEALNNLIVDRRDLDRDILKTFVPKLDLVEALRDPRLDKLVDTLTCSFSVHAVATHLLETEHWDFAAVHYDMMQRLCDDFLLFASPQHDAVSDRDYAMWATVTAAGYRVFDFMLSRLAALAPDECRIVLVADGGYRAGAERPMAEARNASEADAWRSGQGFAAILGPGIEGAGLTGAHIRGLAPTVCALGNLQEDVAWPLPSWVEVEGTPRAVLAVATSEGPAIAPEAQPWSEAVMAQMENWLADEQSRIGALGVLEERLAMVQSLGQVGELARAATILEEIVTLDPGSLRYQSALFELNLARRDVAAARRQIEAAVASSLDPVLISVAKAQLQLAERKPDEALETLRTAPAVALVLQTRANCLARLGNWREAEALYRRVITSSPRVGGAYEGLGRCLLAQRREDEVVTLALKSEATFGATLLSSYYLGLALHRVRETDAAVRAWERCIAIAPDFAPAYRRLQGIFLYEISDPAKAAMYGALGKVARSVRLKRRSALKGA
ncbi:MAG: alkaline phosphatase family protein [Pseudomonadota bacterium]